ncbi:hypothetical protein AQPE_0668 [Aquipluma nitroreducens]|uniref:Uncharacterized protein n=1 Tax=Aquipluma nitroreducens TaxID=2010828 RepID=A0A5K7S4U8_9BACT|nr:hypothetical protein AQPE_0668 [Aquipluma nitroreducens]
MDFNLNIQNEEMAKNNRSIPNTTGIHIIALRLDTLCILIVLPKYSGSTFSLYFAIPVALL